MPDPTQPDVADLCAEAIFKAKRERPAIFKKDVAGIIRATLAAYVPPGPVDGKAYGDRKQIPPTPAQVEAYSRAIGYPLDGQAWCDSYEQKGWMVGRTRMKDWQAGIRTWKKNGYGLRGGVALPAARKQDSTL